MSQMSPEEAKDAKRFEAFMKTEEFQNSLLREQSLSTTKLLRKLDVFVDNFQRVKSQGLSGIVMDLMRAKVWSGMTQRVVEKKLDLSGVADPINRRYAGLEEQYEALSEQWSHVKKPSAPKNRKLKQKMEEIKKQLDDSKKIKDALSELSGGGGAGAGSSVAAAGGGGAGGGGGGGVAAAGAGASAAAGGAGSAGGGAAAAAGGGAAAAGVAAGIVAVVVLALKKVFDETMAPALDVARGLKAAAFPKLVSGLNIALEPWMDVMEAIGEMFSPVFIQMIQKAMPTLIDQLPKIQQTVDELIESGVFEDIGDNISEMVQYLPEMIKIWMEFVALDWQIVIQLLIDAMPTIISFLSSVNDALAWIKDTINNIKSWGDSKIDFQFWPTFTNKKMPSLER